MTLHPTRHNSYEAVGNFEAQYWKKRGEAWQQWAIQQGYAPSAESHRAHPEKYNNEDGTDAGAAAAPDAPVDKASPPPLAATEEFSYWDYLDADYYREKAADWERYAQAQGFIPSFGGDGPSDVPRRLDAYDDRLDRYDAVAEFEKTYWKAYADGWVQWAQDMGYAPSPESQRVAAAKAESAAQAASSRRRLDAYDDRMDRYAAVGEFEQAYWKAYADGWAQWAQDMGYAPSPESQRLKAAQQQPQPQPQPQQLQAADEDYVDVPRRLDAYDQRVGQYEAVGNQQADYWNKYGNGWAQWAARQGYVPPPQPATAEGEGQQQQQQQQEGQGRRLDAFDARMNRYDAVKQAEADYWSRCVGVWMSVWVGLGDHDL